MLRVTRRRASTIISSLADRTEKCLQSEMETHFSLKRLFVSTALIAVGLAVMVRVVQVVGLFHWVIDFPICFVAGALLGAGALVPFKRAGLGAAIGFSLSILYLVMTLLKW